MKVTNNGKSIVITLSEEEGQELTFVLCRGLNAIEEAKAEMYFKIHNLEYWESMTLIISLMSWKGRERRKS